MTKLIPSTKVPIVPPADKYIRVPLSALSESASNPRKHYDAAKLKELAESIALNGVLQAPLVRPLRVAGQVVPDKYEIVFGHRRIRALGLTDRKDVEVLVLDMDDHDAAGKQLIENDSREDLTPLERAEGYLALHQKHGLSYDQIAEQVNKSRAAVYSAKNLCGLTKLGKEKLSAGELVPAVAELIAALPERHHEELVQRALGEFGESWKRDGITLSYREVKELIQDEFMLKLKDAPFDTTDAQLVPEAGACTTCPKRTGAAQLDLLADDGKKNSDSCLDRPCHAAKVTAHKRVVVKEAKEQDKKVLSAGESKKALSGAWNSNWVKLSDPLSESANGKTTIAAALEGVEVGEFAVSDTGKLVKVARKADVKKALKEKGGAAAKLANSNRLTEHEEHRHSQQTPEQKAAAEKRAAELAAAEVLHRKVAGAAIARVVDHIEKKGLTSKLLRLVVGRVVFSGASREAYERRGLKLGESWPQEKDFEKHFGTAKDNKLLGFLFEVCDEELGDCRQGEYSETLAEACAVVGVKLSELEEQLAPPKPKPIVWKKTQKMLYGTSGPHRFEIDLLNSKFAVTCLRSNMQTDSASSYRNRSDSLEDAKAHAAAELAKWTEAAR